MTTERRDFVRPVELRTNGAVTTIRGYAYVFNALSRDLGGFRERIDPGAGRDSLASAEIVATFNHDPDKVLARTGNGLRVGEDDTGGWYEIDLPNTSAGRDVSELVTRGILQGSSFSFTLADHRADQEFTRDEATGELVRSLRRFDVHELGPVTNPAYPDTSVALRFVTAHTARTEIHEGESMPTSTDTAVVAEERARAEHELAARAETGDTNAEARILALLDRLDARFAELTAERRAEEARSLAVELLSHGGVAPETASIPDDNTAIRSLSEGQAVEFRASRASSRAVMGVGIDAANKQLGKAVPIATLYTQLTEMIAERSNVISGGARTMTTSTGEKLTFPRVVPTLPTTKTAEGAALPENYPSTNTVDNLPEKYGYVSHLSAELVQDDVVDLVGFLVADAAPNLADQMGRDFVASLLSGIVIKNTVATMAKEATAADHVIDTFYSLPTAQANRATWIAGRKMLARLRKLKDDHGQFLVKSLADGGSLTLMGRPVLLDAALGDDVKQLVLSDLSGYIVRFAGPLRVARSTEARYVEDLVSFKFVQRAGGSLVDTTGSALLTLPAPSGSGS